MIYDGPTADITPHRDDRRYAHLVAILSLWGSARVDVVADREGRQSLDSLPCIAGDLDVRLRGSGSAATELRPLDVVHGPTEGSPASLASRVVAGGRDSP
jgi:hypothetical protein